MFDIVNYIHVVKLLWSKYKLKFRVKSKGVPCNVSPYAMPTRILLKEKETAHGTNKKIPNFFLMVGKLSSILVF